VDEGHFLGPFSPYRFSAIEPHTVFHALKIGPEPFNVSHIAIQDGSVDVRAPESAAVFWMSAARPLDREDRRACFLGQALTTACWPASDASPVPPCMKMISSECGCARRHVALHPGGTSAAAERVAINDNRAPAWYDGRGAKR
jgi:hypothetical protein